MPGRSYTSQSYRYGFQGQERDDEVKGSGNSINYKYRMHDPRLGRFFSVDPLHKDYPMWSPYVFSGNRVIDKVELEGLEPADPDQSNTTVVKKVTSNSVIYELTTTVPIPDNTYNYNQYESTTETFEFPTDENGNIVIDVNFKSFDDKMEEKPDFSSGSRSFPKSGGDPAKYEEYVQGQIDQVEELTDAIGDNAVIQIEGQTKGNWNNSSEEARKVRNKTGMNNGDASNLANRRASVIGNLFSGRSQSKIQTSGSPGNEKAVTIKISGTD